jgi:hypothetical protein
MTTKTTLRALIAIALGASSAMAQTSDKAAAAGDGKTGDSTPAAAPTPASKVANPIVIQHIRPVDKRGIYMFESPKDDATPFTGFRVDWGAAFTQQFQGLKHETKAAPRIVSGVDQNKLMEIGKGFNNAAANLYLNAQIAKGMRVALTTYLSSKHHQETWVKDGYFLIDASPIDVDVLNKLMEVVTLRIGHMEINYGDAHFRRSDNGNAIYNPFVGNLIMDAFTTEIGAEVYARKAGFLGMLGVSNGEIKGNVQSRADASPAVYGKLGFDRQLTDDVRVRLTGSLYNSRKSPANTLFAGDRAGSRYNLVLENSAATTTAQASSGVINPGFRYSVNAMQINPFVKVGGLEFFGVYEKAKGNSKTGTPALPEAKKREFTQTAADVIYRLLDDQLYVGYRYNDVQGRLVGMTNDIGVNRNAIAAGWYITPSLMFKGEYVNQKYEDFPTTDIRSGGKFKGFMVEGVVAW